MTTNQFTLSVIQAGLNAAADEMFTVLRKTAMSPIIYEVLDVGTGITDGDGNLLSSGAGIPTFVGVLDKAVKAIVARHGDEIADGDIFITNDPNYGGVTHLSDVVIAQPVFHQGRRVAWSASIAHWGDIGGKVPGSMATDVSEIFAEGLRLPAVRLFERNTLIESVFEIIRVNSRLPEFVTGDLWAQVAAGRTAAGCILDIHDSYGPDAVEAAVADSFETGHARAIAGLKALPKGRFTFSERQDDGSLWNAEIDISEDRFTVDLRDNPDQYASPYNTSHDGATISCQMLFKALCDPARFANAGSFRPLCVLTRANTIFHAGPTAPHGYYFETRIRLFDLLWQCISRANPDLLPAGSFSSIFGTVITGRHPDTGRSFAMVEPQMGGWGATSRRNGMSAMFSTSHGDTYNCPVEICEARYGIDVDCKSLIDRPETGGRFAGGHGVAVQYGLRTAAQLSVGYTRARVPVWSKSGCQPGGTNSMTVHRTNGATERHQFVSGLELAAGDRVRLETANGGNSG